MSRIVVIGHHLSVPGTDEYWKKYSAKAKQDVYILRPRHWKEGEALIENKDGFHNGIHFCTFTAPLSRYRKQNLYFFLNMFRFFYLIKQIKPEFIYVMNTTNSLICLQTIIIGRCLGFKVMGWASRLEPRNFFKTFGFIKGLIFTALRFVNARSINAIHATTEKAREALILENHQCPIYVAFTNGIPPHFIDNSVSFKEHDSGVLTVGYAGELLDFKGVDLLIKAINKLPSDNVKLLIAGVGPEGKKLERLTGTLDVDAKFLGYIDNLSMPEFYSQCDVVVLPSKGGGVIVEKFGRVLIEAAACGCAVVGSDVGGIPLALGPDGLLFHDGSVGGLVSVLSRMFDAETLLLEKTRSHKFATSNYSMAIVSEEFFNSVVKKFI
jgi:glycosyltransferase involved in cell wall biosynthesis